MSSINLLNVNSVKFLESLFSFVRGLDKVDHMVQFGSVLHYKICGVTILLSQCVGRSKDPTGV